MLHPAFIDHLVFRVSDLNRSENFYASLLGPPIHRDDFSLMYKVGECRLFFTSATEKRLDRYDKEAIGLNHIAFGVRTLSELRAIQTQLDEQNISNSGLQIDAFGQKEFIWLDDPDNLRIEFYLRSE